MDNVDNAVEDVKGRFSFSNCEHNKPDVNTKQLGKPEVVAAVMTVSAPYVDRGKEYDVSADNVPASASVDLSEDVKEVGRIVTSGVAILLSLRLICILKSIFSKLILIFFFKLKFYLSILHSSLTYSKVNNNFIIKVVIFVTVIIFNQNIN